MKLFIILLVLFPIGLAAQECKMKKLTDPYTKEVKLSTGLIKLNGASLNIDADGKEIDFFFSMDGKEKCFTDASTAAVFYEGTKMKANFKNNGSMNCDGFFHIVFKNGKATPTLLQRLITQKITSIVFTGNNKVVTTVSFTPEDQEKLMLQGDCLVKEAKLLIR